MDLKLTLSDREIRPQVVNFFQYENQTTTMVFTLDSYMYGEVDLRNYKAYAVTSQNGLVDMTELVMNYDEGNDELDLYWEVQEYSLRQEGAVTYQIVFKENADDGENTAVFNSYKGVIINRGSVDADNHITANYPTLLKQWLDKMAAMETELNTIKDNAIDELEEVRAETVEDINGFVDDFNSSIIYIPYGETVTDRIEGHLYYQYTDSSNTKGQFEDHNGNVLSELDTSKTNCITEIPQDIKLELVDGALTLKAGSKVYIPNGFEADGSNKFDVVTIAFDISNTYTGATFSNLVFVSPTNTLHKPNCNMYSGSTAPSGESYMMWYDTENNSVKYTSNGGSTWVGGYSLPVCLQTTTSGSGTTSIDKVFNGFGYIGSTVYALPGVKGLAPNGRSSDGTLNNMEFETKSVITRTFAASENKQDVCLLFNGESFARLEKDVYVYDEVKNENVDGYYNYVHAHIGSLDVTSGVVSDFNIKVPFRAVDYNDLKNVGTTITYWE